MWEQLLLHPVMCYSLLAIFALAVGSLLNLIIYRLPILLRSQWISECSSLLAIETTDEKSINLFFPRSFCPSCKNTIKAVHNIPVLSYLFLLGRCAYCRTPIPKRYPLVELLSCAVAVYAAWHFGFNLTLVFVLLFLWITIVMVFIDFDHQLLPDCLSHSLLWLGLLANTQGLFTTLQDAVISSCIAYLSLWLLIKIYYLLTGKIGMGNGDFKLFSAYGAWFGYAQLPLILLVACFTGAIVGLIYLKSSQQHKDTPIPFGPFLALASVISLFYGDKWLNWYLAQYPVLH